MKFQLIALSIAFLLLVPGCISPPANQPPSTAQNGAQACYGMGCMMRGAPETGKPYRPASFSNAEESREISIENGTTFQLEANIASKKLFGKEQYLNAYNSQLPGPTLKVKQGSKVFVNFTNRLDAPTTVHWHGIRLQNAYDGVPGITQDEVQPGNSFLYELDFPDAGTYWYHPHVREEMQQERGLYGIILVEPSDSQYYGRVDKEYTIALDDILLAENGEPYPFMENYTNFAMMGRYGNFPLINGKESLKLPVKTGETVRLHFLDASNVRPFNISIEGTQLKMIASDGGKFEREFFADSFVISPSERYIADVAFSKPGTYAIYNRNPLSSAKLGEIEVSGPAAYLPPEFLVLQNNTDVTDGIAQFSQYFNLAPDYEYELEADIPGAMPGMGMMMGHTEDGIEWEDTMFGMNFLSTNETLTWRLKDAKTGKYNMDASHGVAIGKPIKIRLRNRDNSTHPMQHPIHLHGAQFLVLEKDWVKNTNMAWKDTVLVPTGSYVDVLAYFPNKGEWMLHCHIAEHLGSGMMSSFKAA